MLHGLPVCTRYHWHLNTHPHPNSAQSDRHSTRMRRLRVLPVFDGSRRVALRSHARASSHRSMSNISVPWARQTCRCSIQHWLPPGRAVQCATDRRSRIGPADRPVRTPAHSARLAPIRRLVWWRDACDAPAVVPGYNARERTSARGAQRLRTLLLHASARLQA
jgi:hypothetical protein